MSLLLKAEVFNFMVRCHAARDNSINQSAKDERANVKIFGPDNTTHILLTPFSTCNVKCFIVYTS